MSPGEALLLSGEANRLAADRVVLAQRVPCPVVLHDDAAQIRVPLDRDAHQVVGLALVPVRGRPDADDARDRLAVVDGQNVVEFSIAADIKVAGA